MLFAAPGLIPHIAHRTSNVEFVRSLVRHHLGWSILVQRPYDGGDADEFVVRELEPTAPTANVVTVRAKGRPSARVATLEDFVIETYGENSYLGTSAGSTVNPDP